jgi:hypothetical protein
MAKKENEVSRKRRAVHKDSEGSWRTLGRGASPREKYQGLPREALSLWSKDCPKGAWRDLEMALAFEMFRQVPNGKDSCDYLVPVSLSLMALCGEEQVTCYFSS